MALIGGGGAGNVAGGNPSGTGTSLNYVGDFAYLHTGIVDATDTETILADFTTGTNMIDASIQFHYAAAATDDFAYRIKINSEEVVKYFVGGGTVDTFINDVILILAPYSSVQITAENVSSSSGVGQCATLRGRVYA